LRHLTAWWAGEDLDPESGLHHLAHAACCLMFLLEYTQTHTELDDRPRQPDFVNKFVNKPPLKQSRNQSRSQSRNQTQP